MNAQPESTARELFGWDSLLPGQRKALKAATDGRNVLCVLPTGYGKSAIYQVAAMTAPGVAVVVMEYENDIVTVLFEEHGYKSLSIPLVEEKDLLRTVAP